MSEKPISPPRQRMLERAAYGQHDPLALAGDDSAPRAPNQAQLVLSDRPAGAGRDHGVVSLTTWRVVTRH
jgi:hypothetical protein